MKILRLLLFFIGCITTPSIAFSAHDSIGTQTSVQRTKAKGVPPVVRSHIGQITEANDALSLTLVNQLHGYGTDKTYDSDISSPKSVRFSADGSKFYVNSLEGCKTVVYDSKTLKKLATIRHQFDSGTGDMWLAPSGNFSFTHYKDGQSRPFHGKPVESTLTADGRYMIIPYYRRSFDINAQDPSAFAVIDTRTDKIVTMSETGPLAKMVAVSNDGKTLAVTHWGDNTVALMDISSPSPSNWRYRSLVTVHHRHPLNYSLTTPVDRDSGSGYALRGTLFLPGDSILLVSAMGGSIAVIDAHKGKWLGFVPALNLVRHIVADDKTVYFSQNSAGLVLSLPLDTLVKDIASQRDKTQSFTVHGLRRVKVGSGARTIELSPSGRFLFAACNSSSALYVVDTRQMKVIATTPVDSYPVGLDVSPDGTMLVVTSQGRKGHGGNAVNIFKIEYAHPEPDKSLTPGQNDAVDTSALQNAQTQSAVYKDEVNKHLFYIIIGSVAALIIVTLAVIILRIRRRHR